MAEFLALYIQTFLAGKKFKFNHLFPRYFGPKIGVFSPPSHQKNGGIFNLLFSKLLAGQKF